MKSTDEFQIEAVVSRLNGDPVGQVRVEPDWVPAEEHLKFLALRNLAALGGAFGIEPVWSDLGRPHVASVRAGLRGSSASGISVTLKTEYFTARVCQAASVFVDQKKLNDGELFNFQLLAMQRSHGPRATALFQFEDVTVAPETQTADLQEFLRASDADDEAEPGAFPVFIARSVIAEAERLARVTPEIEVGALLLSVLHRDVDRGDGPLPLFLEITALVPPPATSASATSFCFKPEFWKQAANIAKLRKRGEQVNAWAHSHPDWCLIRKCSAEKQKTCALKTLYFSGADEHLHRAAFYGAHQIALVLKQDGNTYKPVCFGWREGMIAKRGFHVMRNV